MSALTYVVTDSATMLRRNLKRMVRYPTMLFFVIGIPVVLMLLFVYVFGGTLGAGLGTAAGVAASGTRSDYVDYLVPGILVLTLAGGGQGAAISVAMDMGEGIIARFKTMAISRSAVLMGHVVGTVLQTLIGLVAVTAVAVAIGFRPDANVAEWAAALGLLTLIAWGLTWLCIACGLAAKSVETASNTPMFLTLLPFLGSAFVPVASMPVVLRQFATYQPFTPVTETVRGLLTGTAIHANAIGAIAWSIGLTVAAYLWAVHLYTHRQPR
jgi:ABC-2 type transport system permease protein